MEVSEQNQELLFIFSQMLQVFPHIPHDIIWMYVQRYSNDVEKCAQMLNLQCGKYTNLRLSTSDDSKNMNELQVSHLLQPSETLFDISNDLHLNRQVSSLNRDMNKNTTDNHQTVTESESATNVQSEDASNHISPCGLNANYTDSSRTLSHSAQFPEPLSLHINVDEDEDSLHSWRPNLSVASLCSDFFLPSPMFDNLEFNSNQMSNLVFERQVSEIEMNPAGVHQMPWRYPDNSMNVFYGYPSHGGNAYGVDISSHLHFQKSQMNDIRYEVIKAKIELSDLKESLEKLTLELKEKMQSKSVQDIEQLNEEIVQLRLECQCMCTEVDYCLKDQVLLGEVNENCYNKRDTSKDTIGSLNPTSNRCQHPVADNSIEVRDELNKWQCPKCTFDNHPAINVCEMCHLPRPCIQRPSYLSSPPSSCYCHPKKESLSVQS